MKKMYFAWVAFLMTTIAFSQGTITGTVIDGELNEPLPGASVVLQGTTNGTSTDFDGKFQIEITENAGTLLVSYIGYTSKKVAYTSGGNIGNIVLEPNAQELEGVVVSGVIDIAKDRETPVAVSTIRAAEIQEKLGSQELPEILKSTPSIYATKTGGGFGDGRVNVRGFDSRNTAVMVNGIPVNDMENGAVYWSNWAGLGDVTTAMQVQRGLGSSKLAISSVGGTINVITKSTEKEEGGTVTLGGGNDGYLKTNVAYNTGKSDKGFAASILLGRTSGDGYIQGTEFEGYNYFIGLGYEPNEKHNFQFVLTGAPQVHNQRTSSFFNVATLADHLEYGAKYNYNDGTLNGEEFGWRRNFYHKPITSLTWEWKASEKSTLSTSVYASFGRGGGTGDIGSGPNSGFASSSRYRIPETGQVDYDLISRFNGGEAVTFYDGNDYQLSPNTDGEYITTSFGDGLARRASINSHNWFGLIANLNTQINEKWSYDVGLDLRSYKGIHYRRMDNLLGADGYFDDDDINNPNHVVRQDGVVDSDFSSILNVFKSIDDEEKIDYYNDGLVRWAGAFGQVEYTDGVVSAFVQGGISNQGFKRIDYFNYLDSDPLQETDWENILGGNIKGGVNFNINEANNVFFNGGYYSKQPLFDAVYINFVNELNPDLTNEKILGLELGYGLNLGDFRAKVNIYRTTWKDRFVSIGVETPTGDEGNANINGVEQIHQGIEIEANYRASEVVQFRGMLSLGDWEYGGNAFGQALDDDRNIIDPDVSLFLDGVKVGDAAQFTTNLEMIIRPIEDLKISANLYNASRLYAFLNAEDFDSADNNGSLRLPSYTLFDLGAYYTFGFGGSNKLSIAANVNNLFDTEYIAESLTNTFAGSGDSLYEGISTDNKVFFGFGRTFNVSARYSF
ncbi:MULTISPECIES: TonB-dependent receptor domain-containing protein [Zobellia]|uniref:TonB-dependent receptor n=1 Tax=Zobellia TaxID=112040 RepID=UPI001BFF1FA0|nr:MULTISPECIES: TonB-dependent receptor [Zobellia]MBT9187220.1 TonB-dependent receptor [Zobellia russellii]MDO6817884.1 TonB-dependent receptor [Zobellia sp. 1_MG-2023]